jgi:hypothetical protein
MDDAAFSRVHELNVGRSTTEGHPLKQHSAHQPNNDEHRCKKPRGVRLQQLACEPGDQPSDKNGSHTDQQPKHLDQFLLQPCYPRVDLFIGTELPVLLPLFVSGHHAPQACSAFRGYLASCRESAAVRASPTRIAAPSVPAWVTVDGCQWSSSPSVPIKSRSTRVSGKEALGLADVVAELRSGPAASKENTSSR